MPAVFIVFLDGQGLVAVAFCDLLLGLSRVRLHLRLELVLLVFQRKRKWHSLALLLRLVPIIEALSYLIDHLVLRRRVEWPTGICLLFVELLGARHNFKLLVQEGFLAGPKQG